MGLGGLLACLALLGAVRAESATFAVTDKLEVDGGVDIATSPTAAPLIFASSMTDTGNVGIATAAPSARLHVADGDIRISTTTGSRGLIFQDGTKQVSAGSVLQTRIYSDYTARTTATGGYYYFGAAGQYDNAITPAKSNSIILVTISYFGEANTHDIHTILQYSIGGGAWTNWDLVPGTGQQGTLKLGSYPDADYNSTPHNYSTQVAKSFATTSPVSFRMYHYNGGTFYHNCSVAVATYESGPSTLTLQELDAEKASYVKR